MGAYDLGELGPAQVASSGLQGLLEAYKMKLGQAQEEAKTRQGGFNASAATQAMMPYRMESLAEKARHDRATEAAADPGNSAAIMARDTLNGTYDPTQAPKRGAIYARYITELDKQSEGNPDLINAAQAAKAKMFESGQTAQRVQRSSEALVPLVDSLKKSLGYNAETGAYDKPTPQSQYPIVNRIKSLWGANVAGGDPRKDITANTLAIQKELNMMAANGGSDKNLAMAGEMMDPNAPVGDLIKGVNIASQGLAAGRSQAYGGTNPFIKQISAMTPSGKAAAVAPPAPPAPAAPTPQYTQTGTHADGSKWGLNPATNQWEQIR